MNTLTNAQDFNSLHLNVKGNATCRDIHATRRQNRSIDWPLQQLKVTKTSHAISKSLIKRLAKKFVTDQMKWNPLQQSLNYFPPHVLFSEFSAEQTSCNNTILQEKSSVCQITSKNALENHYWRMGILENRNPISKLMSFNVTSILVLTQVLPSLSSSLMWAVQNFRLLRFGKIWWSKLGIDRRLTASKWRSS